MSETVSARRMATRERLMDAAVALFAERGVLAASVEEISDRAGFTRGAFYSNFESRDDLCVAVLERFAEAQLRATREATAEAVLEPGSTTVEELIDRAVAVFIHSQPEDADELIAHAELRLHAARNPQVRDALNLTKERISAAIEDVITTALARFDAELSLPMGQALDVLHGVYEHGGLSAIIDGRESPASARAAQLAAVLRSMIRTCGSEPACKVTN